MSRRSLMAGIAVALTSSVTAGSAAAATFTWDGGALQSSAHFREVHPIQTPNGVTNVSNWGTSAPGGYQPALPGADDDVFFPADAVVGSSGADGIGNLINNGKLITWRRVSLNGDSLHNTGEIWVNGWNDEYLAFRNNATLSGGGTLIGNPGQSGGMFLSGWGSLTVPAGNYIRGHGEISVDIVNQSTITAQNRTLTVANATIDNTDGEIIVDNGAALSLNGGGNSGSPPAVIRGGLIHGEPGSQVFGWNGNAWWEDVALTGNHNLGNNTLVWRGAITNDSTFGFSAGGSRYRTIAAIGEVLLSGHGEFILGNHGLNRTRFAGTTGPEPDTIINDTNHTIRGYGYFERVGLVNRGIISPGVNPGETGWFSGDDFVAGETSRLEIDIRTYGQEIWVDHLRFDYFEKNGTLAVNIADDVPLAPGQVFEIVRANDDAFGSFDKLEVNPLPDGNQLMVRTVRRNGDEYIELVVTGPETGDFNNDGVINQADFTVWRDALDLGLMTKDDYHLFNNRFNWRVLRQVTPLGNPVAAPEPTTAAILFATALATAGKRRRLQSDCVQSAA
ncbi:MAG: hypothetical protein AAGJ46_10615 [Planctomycetota bacterium]